jgi:hypothetical protein
MFSSLACAGLLLQSDIAPEIFDTHLATVDSPQGAYEDPEMNCKERDSLAEG